MKKPYTICHMMMSVDGRIDCAMTVKLEGTKEYYEALASLETTANVSGRVTAELEMALPGSFESENRDAFGKGGFSKKTDSSSYTVVVDTRGTLLWPEDSTSEEPLIVLTSEKVRKNYLAYLDEQSVSWIVCGKERIDLVRASEILAKEFGVERMAIVGGGSINAAFLDAGLLDEVSVLIAPGIDGRKGMTSTFDGLPTDREPYQLKMESVTSYENGVVWIRYQINKTK